MLLPPIHESVPAVVASGGAKRYYETDGDLDPLRGHPRFKAILERI